MQKSGFKFHKKFLWGASVSTYQVEGWNHNQWSVWELESAKILADEAYEKYGHLESWDKIKHQATNPENYISGKGAEHYKRYKDDFKIAKSLNFNALRSGIEWSRIEPKEGEFNSAALDHYRKYFNEMKKAGIVPVVTLWHWTMPVWFAQKGGFKKRSNVEYFVRYVEYLLSNAPELFDDFVITINEPTVYASESHMNHRWPPQEKSAVIMHRVLVNLALAHRKIYKKIKLVNKNCKVGLAHHAFYFYTNKPTLIANLAIWITNKMANEFFINLCRKKNQDFFGLNYYTAQEFQGIKIVNKTKKVNDLGWPMQPEKVGQLIKQLYKKYNLPIMITETGVADHEDRFRQWWISENIKAIESALNSGVEVIGYIHWSLLDNFEWAEGFWPRFGLVEVDYKTQTRKVRQSAKWYSQIISAQTDK